MFKINRRSPQEAKTLRLFNLELWISLFSTAIVKAKGPVPKVLIKLAQRQGL